MACYVVNTSTDDDSGKKKCVPVLEDYYECLHHKKEVSRECFFGNTSVSTNNTFSMREHWPCRLRTCDPAA